MSVSLAEVIQSGGYDLSKPDDCRWLLSRKFEFEELVEFAENVIEEAEDAEQKKHNRFDEEHRKVCNECYRDYDDFCQEQVAEARLDEMSESQESEES